MATRDIRKNIYTYIYISISQSSIILVRLCGQDISFSTKTTLITPTTAPTSTPTTQTTTTQTTTATPITQTRPTTTILAVVCSICFLLVGGSLGIVIYKKLTITRRRIHMIEMDSICSTDSL